MLMNSAPFTWYSGPSLFELMEKWSDVKRNLESPLRLPILVTMYTSVSYNKRVYKHRTIIIGKLFSGILRVGDELILSGGNTNM